MIDDSGRSAANIIFLTHMYTGWAKKLIPKTISNYWLSTEYW